MPGFLQGHVEASGAFGGVPRRLLHDNLKSTVTARRGRAVTFHPTLPGLAAHHPFEPHAAWPGRPRGKGRVERRAGFVRTGFIAGRDLTVPLAEPNAAARDWRAGTAADRPWPDDDSLLVRDAFVRERPMQVPLPADPFPSAEVRPVRVDGTSHARFDRNGYSVPPDFAGAGLTLAADRDTVRIPGGIREVAHHQRCHDRKRAVTDPGRTRAIVLRRRQARSMGVRDRPLRSVPRAEGMPALAGHRRENVATCARMLADLVDTHGADGIDRAVAVALERGPCHANTVRGIVEVRRAAQGLPPAVPADGGGIHGTTLRGTGPISVNLFCRRMLRHVSMSKKAVKRSIHPQVSPVSLLSLAIRASGMEDSKPLSPCPKNRLTLMGTGPAACDRPAGHGKGNGT